MLMRADVFFTRGPGLVSRLIRVLTRTIGESRTQVNHVGLVVEDGPLQEACMIEAVRTVQRHGLWETYGPPRKDWVAVYRPTNLTDAEVTAVVGEAEKHWRNAESYGYGKIACHILDWMLLGAYVFRRLARSERYPICSWLVADAFKEAGKNFGVAPGAASPDDIWDFVQSHPSIYEVVYPLAPLREAAAEQVATTNPPD